MDGAEAYEVLCKTGTRQSQCPTSFDMHKRWYLINNILKWSMKSSTNRDQVGWIKVMLNEHAPTCSTAEIFS